MRIQNLDTSSYRSLFPQSRESQITTKIDSLPTEIAMFSMYLGGYVDILYDLHFSTQYRKVRDKEKNRRL